MNSRMLFFSMISTALVSVISTASIVASAQSEPSLPPNSESSFAFQTLPGTLHDTMKAMGKMLKQIVSQAGDSTRNSASAALAEDFAQVTLHAKNFVPDSLLSLPADQRATAIGQYNQLLNNVSELGHSLSLAFTAGDNAKALQLLAQLDALKKQGHGLFK